MRSSPCARVLSLGLVALVGCAAVPAPRSSLPERSDPAAHTPREGLPSFAFTSAPASPAQAPPPSSALVPSRPLPEAPPELGPHALRLDIDRARARGSFACELAIDARLEARLRRRAARWARAELVLTSEGTAHASFGCRP